MQKYFCGVINKDKYSQIVQVDMIPAGTNTDAQGNVIITSYTRNLYVGSFETRTYVFEGVPAKNSLPGSTTVTDIAGGSHEVKFSNYTKDGSSGPAVFETDNNHVTIRHMSPHLLRIEVTRRVGTLYLNNKVQFGESF